jgi:hypothetical protein
MAEARVTLGTAEGMDLCWALQTRTRELSRECVGTWTGWNSLRPTTRSFRPGRQFNRTVSSATLGGFRCSRRKTERLIRVDQDGSVLLATHPSGRSEFPWVNPVCVKVPLGPTSRSDVLA